MPHLIKINVNAIYLCGSSFLIKAIIIILPIGSRRKKRRANLGEPRSAHRREIGRDREENSRESLKTSRGYIFVRPACILHCVRPSPSPSDSCTCHKNAVVRDGCVMYTAFLHLRVRVLLLVHLWLNLSFFVFFTY